MIKAGRNPSGGPRAGFLCGCLSLFLSATACGESLVTETRVLDDFQPLLDRLSPRVLIFAASRDKDVANMLNQLLHRFDRVLLTRFANNPRAMTLEELHDAACESTGRQRGGNQLEGEPSLPWEAIESASETWRRARQLAGPGGLVCITGSFFLAGQIREDVARSLRDE